VNTTAAIAAIAGMWTLGVLSLAFSLPPGFWTADPDESETQTARRSDSVEIRRRSALRVPRKLLTRGHP
jgi:hypothetical protein